MCRFCLNIHLNLSLLIYLVFITLGCLCMYVCLYMCMDHQVCHQVCVWRSGDNLWGLFLSFHNVGSLPAHQAWCQVFLPYKSFLWHYPFQIRQSQRKSSQMLNSIEYSLGVEDTSSDSAVVPLNVENNSCLFCSACFMCTRRKNVCLPTSEVCSENFMCKKYICT